LNGISKFNDDKKTPFLVYDDNKSFTLKLNNEPLRNIFESLSLTEYNEYDHKDQNGTSKYYDWGKIYR
jgi:hypothetical protein